MWSIGGRCGERWVGVASGKWVLAGGCCRVLGDWGGQAGLVGEARARWTATGLRLGELACSEVGVAIYGVRSCGAEGGPRCSVGASEVSCVQIYFASMAPLGKVGSREGSGRLDAQGVGLVWVQA